MTLPVLLTRNTAVRARYMPPLILMVLRRVTAGRGVAMAWFTTFIYSKKFRRPVCVRHGSRNE